MWKRKGRKEREGGKYSQHCTVHAPFKCCDTFCAWCYQRETHTAGIRTSVADRRQRVQYCHTTLNTLSHTPWLQPPRETIGEHIL